MAYITLETCEQCGNPKWICRNPDNDIQFDMTPETCEVTAARMKRERRDAKDADEGQLDGRSTSVEVYTSSRTDLAEFRAPYYDAQRKLQEVREKSRPVRPREHPPGWTP